VIGLVASLLLMIYHSTRPHLASLGRVPGVPGAYSDLKRHPENMPIPGVLILRLDAPIYYANAITVCEGINALIAEADPPIHTIILDTAGQDALDITSVDALKGLVVELKKKGIEIYVTDVHAPVREFSRKMGLAGLIGEGHEFPTLEAALRSIGILA